MQKASETTDSFNRPVHALGMMSGTSLDGVDAAVVETDGQDLFGFGLGRYRAYSDAEQTILRAALGRWDGPEVAAAAAVVEAAHRDVLAGFEGIDIVGFHGQTLAHDPGKNRTLQIGDGAGLTGVLNVPVVWDFRAEDVAKGGEGAPLAPFFHFACARMLGLQAPVCFLNLGGVGNLTFVDPSFERPEEPGALLAFDTGPANAPINDLMQARFGKDMDRDGAVAATGAVAMHVLGKFLEEPYFTRDPPKSLDRNDFDEISTLVDGLPDADAVATLTAMSVAAIVLGIAHCPHPPARVLVTGGGRLNPVLMQRLRDDLDCPVDPVEVVGLDGDMLEAQAFAYLAVRVARGFPTSCSSTTGVPQPVGGGIVSAPASRGSPE